MINTNVNKFEKEVGNIEDNIEKELQQKLLELETEDFEKYFEGLIEKYYSTLFSFDKSYINYVENSKKKYNTIKRVKSLCSSKYINLGTYEAYVSLDKVENIAYNQMNELYFMESSYSRIIYYNSIYEVIFLKKTLSNLIDVYEEEPSEKLLSAIGNTLINAVPLMKEVNKLPLDEASLELDFKDEENYVSSFDNVHKYHLEEVLEDFNKTYEKLITILPEDVIAKYESELYKPDLDLYDILKEDCKGKFSDEEIIKAILQMEKNYKGYLYEIING